MANVSAKAPLSSRTVGFLRLRRIGSSSFPRRTFPCSPRLKHSPAYTPWHAGYISGSAPIYIHTAARPSVRTMILVSVRHLPRAPLPAQGVTSYGVVSIHNIRENYLSFIAHTGSCARPNSSCHLDFTLDQQVFVRRGGLRAPARRWPFPTLSPQSLRRCLDPYPAASPQCICSLLPKGQRPHLRRQRFGTPKLSL